MGFHKFIKGDFLTFTYVNYKGEKAVRQALFIEMAYGSNEFHPEEQFFIVGMDYEKRQIRTYAIKDISCIDVILSEETPLYLPSLYLETWSRLNSEIQY